MSSVDGSTPGAGHDSVIVVRRGAMDRFAAMHAAFIHDGVDVRWDRRVAERRARAQGSPGGSDRRRLDRRGPVPPSWTLLDFVVVAPPPAHLDSSPPPPGAAAPEPLDA
jgi:hypothetical protein